MPSIDPMETLLNTESLHVGADRPGMHDVLDQDQRE